METQELLSLIRQRIQFIDKDIHKREDKILVLDHILPNYGVLRRSDTVESNEIRNRWWSVCDHNLTYLLLGPDFAKLFLEHELQFFKALRLFFERAASSPDSTEFKQVVEVAEDLKEEIALSIEDDWGSSFEDCLDAPSGGGLLQMDDRGDQTAT